MLGTHMDTPNPHCPRADGPPTDRLAGRLTGTMLVQHGSMLDACWSNIVRGQRGLGGARRGGMLAVLSLGIFL